MEESENYFNPNEAYAAQEKYCDDNKLPLFAPTRLCYSCRKSIYDSGGYTVKYAATHLITRCPFCNSSYCD